MTRAPGRGEQLRFEQRVPPGPGDVERIDPRVVESQTEQRRGRGQPVLQVCKLLLLRRDQVRLDIDGRLHPLRVPGEHGEVFLERVLQGRQRGEDLARRHAPPVGELGACGGCVPLRLQ